MTAGTQMKSPCTLRNELEAHRLQHRTRRMAFVIDSLREREQAYRLRGQVPRPLHEAIAGFCAELKRDRARLQELSRGSG